MYYINSYKYILHNSNMVCTYSNELCIIVILKVIVNFGIFHQEFILTFGSIHGLALSNMLEDK